MAQTNLGKILDAHIKYHIEEVSQKPFHTSGKSSVVGLDGFVDKIVTPVDKGMGWTKALIP